MGTPGRRRREVAGEARFDAINAGERRRIRLGIPHSRRGRRGTAGEFSWGAGERRGNQDGDPRPAGGGAGERRGIRMGLPDRPAGGAGERRETQLGDPDAPFWGAPPPHSPPSAPPPPFPVLRSCVSQAPNWGRRGVYLARIGERCSGPPPAPLPRDLSKQRQRETYIDCSQVTHISSVDLGLVLCTKDNQMSFLSLSI